LAYKNQWRFAGQPIIKYDHDVSRLSVAHGKKIRVDNPQSCARGVCVLSTFCDPFEEPMASVLLPDKALPLAGLGVPAEWPGGKQVQGRHVHRRVQRTLGGKDLRILRAGGGRGGGSHLGRCTGTSRKARGQSWAEPCNLGTAAVTDAYGYLDVDPIQQVGHNEVAELDQLLRDQHRRDAHKVAGPPQLRLLASSWE
jgi:hypothetical protein